MILGDLQTNSSSSYTTSNALGDLRDSFAASTNYNYSGEDAQADTPGDIIADAARIIEQT